MGVACRRIDSAMEIPQRTIERTRPVAVKTMTAAAIEQRRRKQDPDGDLNTHPEPPAPTAERNTIQQRRH
jgi:hypothetical protein